MARCEDFPCCGHTDGDPCPGQGVVMTAEEAADAYWCDRCGWSHTGGCVEDDFDEEDDEDEEPFVLSPQEQLQRGQFISEYGPGWDTAEDHADDDPDGPSLCRDCGEEGGNHAAGCVELEPW